MILLAARRSLLALLIATPALAQMPRIASDFEILQMERQVARSRDFLSQLSGYLNLGDLRTERNESVLARAEYARALRIAETERRDARRASAMTRYATATSYAALAEAKLGETASAFGLAEEALRYTSDSSKTWNLYASTMTSLQRPAKAASAARNAVAIAERDLQQSPTSSNRLDLAIDQYTLASSLLELNQKLEAEELLRSAVASLRSDAFATLKRGIVQNESFEIYSSARGEEAAYISLLNRAQLRLARLLEDRHDIAHAREQYENVLAARNDDATALAALARLARTAEERERYYADAFDANPFSLPLIRDYERFLSGAPAPSPAADQDSTGGRVRLALQQMQHGELIAATATVDALLVRYPQNDTLKLLRREIDERRSSNTDGELRSILANFRENRLTPEQRGELDRKRFTGTATFNESRAAPKGQTIFESGTIDGVPFRFAEPTAFAGTFPITARLTYRILGATQWNGADALLLEPLRLEPIQ
jgi:hypothetical protein